MLKNPTKKNTTWSDAADVVIPCFRRDDGHQKRIH